MKVNHQGKYTPFHGWTVISELKEHLGFIEHYIRNSTMGKYFTSLPADSYHMTLYNIWSEACPPLKNKNKDKDNIYRLLEQMQAEIDKQSWKDFQLFHSQILYTGKILAITFTASDNFTQANNIRNKMTMAAFTEDNMLYYHITLAYQYKNIPEEEATCLNKELSILNSMLSNKVYTLEKPFVAKFDDMTKFTPCFDRSKYCLGFLVPDKHTQQQIQGLGFDLDAPMLSFKPNPSPFEKNTTFGGVHASIFRRRVYDESCIEILQQIQKLLTNETWSLPKNAYISQGKYQSNINFSCGMLSQIALKGKSLGWPEVITDKYHIGIYSSSLESRTMAEQDKKILACLKKAKWGLILSIDNGDKNFQYDWNTFIPI